MDSFGQVIHYKKGDTVTMTYKTGEYVGIVFDVTSNKLVVQVLAVLRHPEQGDLHHPQDAGVAFFHQRKSLAFRERALVSAEQVLHWEGEVPEYKSSLQSAWQREVIRMQSHSQREWAERGLEQLLLLQKEYGLLDITK